jgi:hypothetical protein
MCTGADPVAIQKALTTLMAHLGPAKTGRLTDVVTIHDSTTNLASFPFLVAKRGPRNCGGLHVGPASVRVAVGPPQLHTI